MQRVKVGDLVKVTNDDDGLFGHGVVLKLLSDGEYAIVRWFDDWQNSEPIDVDRVASLVVISES
tara:strand:- start:75 stop:266 length:192 start_codon:yes stop_codon:yes gene_type:complete